MEENRGSIWEKTPIYLMVQMCVISANRYVATYKTEHRFGEKVSFSPAHLLLLFFNT